MSEMRSEGVHVVLGMYVYVGFNSTYIHTSTRQRPICMHASCLEAAKEEKKTPSLCTNKPNSTDLHTPPRIQLNHIYLLRPPRPSTSPRLLLPAHTIQTPIMHDRVIRPHRNHAPSQTLMAHPTDPFLRDHHAAIPACIPPRHAITQKQGSLSVHHSSFVQAGNDAGGVDDGVSRADTPAEIRLEVGDGLGRGDEREGGGGGEAGAVFGEERERGEPVRGVGRRGGEVQREERVVDGWEGVVVWFGGRGGGAGWGWGGVGGVLG